MTNLQSINKEISTINNLINRTEEDIKQTDKKIYNNEMSLFSLKRDYERVKKGYHSFFGDNITTFEIEKWIKNNEETIKTTKEKKELFIKYLEKLEINKEKLIRDYIDLSNNQDSQDNQDSKDNQDSQDNQDLIYFINKQSEETNADNNKTKKQHSSDDILKKVFGDRIL